MPATLAGLYQQPDLHAHADSQMDIWRQGSVDTVLHRIGEFAHAAGAALVTHLDTLTDEIRQYDQKSRVAALLGSLPAHVLMGTFGTEVTAWTVANDDRSRSEDLRIGLEDAGYANAEFLEASCMLSYRRDRVTPGRSVLAQNAVIETLVGGGLQTVDLPALLSHAALPGVSMREARVRKYDLVPVCVSSGDLSHTPDGKIREWDGKEEVETLPGKDPGLYYDLWIDSYAGFMLRHNKVPQMIVGLQAVDSDAILIAQMQRLRGKRYMKTGETGRITSIVGYKQANGLVRLDWPKLAVGIATQLADHLDAPWVGVREGKKIPSKVSTIPKEHAKEVYDDNADRLSFKRGRDNDWYKPTSELLAAVG